MVSWIITSSVGVVPETAVTAIWNATDWMFVVAMFADVVVVVIAPDAMSVEVDDARLSDVIAATELTEDTVETVVKVPDATAIALVDPNGAL